MKMDDKRHARKIFWMMYKGVSYKEVLRKKSAMQRDVTQTGATQKGAGMAQIYMIYTRIRRKGSGKSVVEKKKNQRIPQKQGKEGRILGDTRRGIWKVAKDESSRDGGERRRTCRREGERTLGRGCARALEAAGRSLGKTLEDH